MKLDALQLLRELGVKAARLDEADNVLEVEFFPLERLAALELGPLAPKGLGTSQDKCRCGHEVYEHAGDGYCLRGCVPDNCIPPPPADSEKRP